MKRNGSSPLPTPPSQLSQRDCSQQLAQVYCLVVGRNARTPLAAALKPPFYGQVLQLEPVTAAGPRHR